MSDLAEFLRARLDEDEAAAKGAQEEWDADWVRYEREDLPDEVYNHVVRHDPARVLREVQAKREIVMRCKLILAAFADRERGEWPDVSRRERAHAGRTLDVLAVVYSDHPDYDPVSTATIPNRQTEDS